MVMTDTEIKKNVLEAADQKAQIVICAELNATDEETIRNILKKQGVDLRKLKSKAKKHIVERKPYKKPEIISGPIPKQSQAVEKESPAINALKVLHERIAILQKQKKTIDMELSLINVELNRIVESISGGEKA